MLPRATLKKMEESREALKKKVMEDGHLLKKINLRPSNDLLKYWDEADKLRVVSRIDLNPGWSVLVPLVKNDLHTILMLQADDGGAVPEAAEDYPGFPSEGKPLFPESYPEDREWEEASQAELSNWLNDK